MILLRLQQLPLGSRQQTLAHAETHITVRIIATNLWTTSGPSLNTTAKNWWLAITTHMATKPEVGQEVTFHLDRAAYPDQANRPAELYLLRSLYDDTPILVTGGQRFLPQVACMWNGPRQGSNQGRRHNGSTGIRDRSNDLQRDKRTTQSKKAELHWDKLPDYHPCKDR